MRDQMSVREAEWKGGMTSVCERDSLGQTCTQLSSLLPFEDVHDSTGECAPLQTCLPLWLVRMVEDVKNKFGSN